MTHRPLATSVYLVLTILALPVLSGCTADAEVEVDTDTFLVQTEDMVAFTTLKAANGFREVTSIDDRYMLQAEVDLYVSDYFRRYGDEALHLAVGTRLRIESHFQQGTAGDGPKWTLHRYRVLDGSHAGEVVYVPVGFVIQEALVSGAS
jgi:hypothetical protein